MKRLFLISAFIAVTFGLKTTDKKNHYCPANVHQICPFTGLTNFRPELSEYYPATDGYILDSLHFYNPELEGDQLTCLMFNCKDTTHPHPVYH
jgi:hypothetical protein